MSSVEQTTPDNPGAGEPYIQLVSLFLRLHAGHQLTDTGARKVLASASTADRVGSDRSDTARKDETGSMLAAIHPLFLQDLDSAEPESAL